MIKICPVCGVCEELPERKLLRCSKCKLAWYCRREHQAEHWKFHKNGCRDLVLREPPAKRKKHILLEDDIPAPMRASQYSPSQDGCDSNLLLLLHGMGDTPHPFNKLAARMALPQTAWLAVQAPWLLPFDMGRTWIEMFRSDGLDANANERKASLAKTRGLLFELVNVLCLKYGWERSSIFLLGFSQGAAVALDVILNCPVALGGAIAVAPEILATEIPSKSMKSDSNTPVLITLGSSDTVVRIGMATAQANAIARCMGDGCVTTVVLNKSHQMIGSEEEMHHVMEFLSKHLYLRNLALEDHPDVIEIT